VIPDFGWEYSLGFFIFKKHCGCVIGYHPNIILPQPRYESVTNLSA